VLDIPWRVKLLLPMLASLPLLIAYSGATAISLPKPVQVGIKTVPVELNGAWMDSSNDEIA